MSKEIQTYSASIKFLHWLISPLVILMLLAGFFLEDLPEAYQGLGFMLHKSLGITILFLMVFRLFWVRIVGRPGLPATLSWWEVYLAKTVQALLYIVVIAMPLAGWIMSVAANRIPVYFGLFELPLPGIPENKSLSHFMKESHEVMAWILIALIFLHVAGALKHHFIDKNDVLKRML